LGSECHHTPKRKQLDPSRTSAARYLPSTARDRKGSPPDSPNQTPDFPAEDQGSPFLIKKSTIAHRNVLWCRPRKVIGADGNGHPEPCGNAVLPGPGMYLEHHST